MLPFIPAPAIFVRRRFHGMQCFILKTCWRGTLPAELSFPAGGPMKLNLGCGQNKKPGYVNVDKFDTFAPDVVWDLETFPWPFEDNSVDEIVLFHVLEHMGASVEVFLSIMKEMYRVCAAGASIHIAVPHPRSEGFAGDPTHVRAITPTILSLFSKRNCAEWQKKGWPNTPLASYLDVDFEIESLEHELTPRWGALLQAGKVGNEQLQEAAEMYFNVINEIRMVLKVQKNTDRAVSA